MKNATDQEVELFLHALTKLGPLEFVGVATYLGVKCCEDEELQVSRPTGEILCDVIDKFCELNWYQRKKLCKMVKKARRVK